MDPCTCEGCPDAAELWQLARQDSDCIYVGYGRGIEK